MSLDACHRNLSIRYGIRESLGERQKFLRRYVALVDVIFRGRSITEGRIVEKAKQADDLLSGCVSNVHGEVYPSRSGEGRIKPLGMIRGH